jgi:uncharacterized iron-regulated protein
MKTHSVSTTAVLFTLMGSALQAQQPGADPVSPAPEYRVFTGQGERASLDDIVSAMAETDVTFIGEEHNDIAGHWIESQLLERAYARYGAGGPESEDPRPVTLSLEMFERDVQDVLDEYLGGLITEKLFRASSRPWDEYETDYRPLVEFAREMGIPVIAANAPRRYVNRVTRLGREALLELTPEALETLAPLPYGNPSAAYRAQWFEVMSSAAEAQEECEPPEGDSTSPDAEAQRAAHDPDAFRHQLHTQALWDATMAFSIGEHLLRNPGALVLHMVGSFHVARGTGIPEHLERYRPGTSRLIVVMRPVEDIEVFDPSRDGENEDFVILTEESATRPTDICQ